MKSYFHLYTDMTEKKQYIVNFSFYTEVKKTNKLMMWINTRVSIDSQIRLKIKLSHSKNLRGSSDLVNDYRMYWKIPQDLQIGTVSIYSKLKTSFSQYQLS
jgi:hypothetical protein